MARYVYKGQVRYCKTKHCIECERERARAYRRNHQKGEVFQSWRKEYEENNKQKILDLNRMNARDYRKRKREQKILERLKSLMAWRTLI